MLQGRRFGSSICKSAGRVCASQPTASNNRANIIAQTTNKRDISYFARIRNSGRGTNFDRWYERFLTEDPIYVNDPSHIKWFPQSLREPENKIKAKVYQRMFFGKPEEMSFNRACLAVDKLRLEYGIVPESWMYAGVLYHIADIKDVYAMTHFWLKIRQNPQIPLEINGFNAMASSYAALYDMEGAQFILEELKGTGQKLTANSFNALCRFNHPTVLFMQAIFESLEKEELKPNTETYVEMMKALVRYQEYQKANDVFAKIQQTGNVPTLDAFNVWISSRLNAGYPSEAREIVEHMHSEKPFKVYPETSTYNLFLAYYERLGNDEEVDHLVKTMKDRGVPLNVDSYNSWLRSKYNAGKPQLTVEVFDNNKYPRNEATYAAVIDACVQSGQYDRAVELIKLMRKRGFTYDERHSPPSYHRSLTTVYPRRCDYWEDGGEHYTGWNAAINFDHK